MKKGIFIALLLCGMQVHGAEYDYQVKHKSFAFADALLWTLKEAGAESWAQAISPSGASQNVNVVGVPFNWQPGFRVGAGRNLCHDHWDIVFAYTFYQNVAHSQANAVTGSISSPFAANFYVNNTNGATITNDPTYRNASMRWKFNFNVFDLELGRKFKVDNVHLRPFIALKGAIINQHMDTNWSNPTNASNFTYASENMKNDFYGIGPAIGLNTRWEFYTAPRYVLNIIANVSGALMWGNWLFKDKYANNTPTNVSVNVSAINGAASMARGLLGIEWAGCIARAEVILRFGYEAQVWFDQMQYYSYSMGRLNSLLSLQGIVLGCGIRF